MEDGKQERQLEKYLEKKRKQRRRDELLREIAELTKKDDRSGKVELARPKEKKKKKHRVEKELKEREESESTVSEIEEADINMPEVLEIHSIPTCLPDTKDDEILISQKFTLRRIEGRDPEVQAVREKLDIFYEDFAIVSDIKSQPVIFIQGSTGCGKTTQIPQFLLEHGFGEYGRICITQPRRFSAVSLAARINRELNRLLCGYKIKYENTVTKDTRIKIVTEGVLLRELASDFTLSEYSVIILDEVHERTVNMDLLVGLLSRVVKVRKETQKPLRVVLMSATACYDAFRRVLGPVPTLTLPFKTAKVSVFFEDKTPENYLDVIYQKIIAIYKVSSSQSNKKLKEKYLLVDTLYPNESYSILVFLPSKEDIYTLKSRLENNTSNSVIIPLHSKLPKKQQELVYRNYGCNKVILATNIAETSITVPDVVFVIDSGLVKIKSTIKCCVRYQTGFISKSSAQQRTGRAGRTRPGVCFRIYSTSTYENFPEQTIPQIFLEPMDGSVLFLKALGVSNISKFPFPDPLDDSQVAEAVRILQQLGALNSEKNITEKGIRMAKYPLTPQQAHLLTFREHRAELHAVASILSVEPEIRRTEGTEEYFVGARSDIIVALRIFSGYLRSEKKEEFSRKVGVSHAVLNEIYKLFVYLLKISGEEIEESKDAVQKVTGETEYKICQCLYQTFIGNIAVKDGNLFYSEFGELRISRDSVDVETNSIVFTSITCGFSKEYAKNVTAID